MAGPDSSTSHETDARLPIPEALLALAPGRLRNQRRARYDGDDLCVALEQLAAPDQELLVHFYQILSELLHILIDTSTDDARKWRGVARWTRQHPVDPFIDAVQKLGVASHAQGPSERLAQSMHDVRGGPLSALLGRLQMLEYRPQTETELQTIFILTRDHLKIMRSAVVGLDEERRSADHRPKSHSMSLILEKWHDATVGPKWRGGAMRMSVDCRYEGTLTECCLESAAIDRIFYNLASNACRHAVGERIDMVIFPLPEPPRDCLRFVLSNEVSAEDAAYLNALVQGGGADSADKGSHVSLFKLFEPAVSSTGSGFGLTVAADFVTRAFGLRDRAEALRGRYVGAILDGRTFRAWFHWPRGHDVGSVATDDLHHPEQSLSEP